MSDRIPYRTSTSLAVLATIMLVGIATPRSTLIAQRQVIAKHVEDAGTWDDVLSRRISLNLRRVSLSEALDSVSRVAKVLVQYPTPLLGALATPVSVRVTNVPLGIVLEQILDGTSLHIKPDGQGNLIVEASGEGRTDSVRTVGSIAGTVVDSATGKGIPGVMISVQGTKQSMLTNAQGGFTIRELSLGERVILAKVFGYRPLSRIVTIRDSARSTIRMTLVPVPNMLSGVVTTATGQQKKLKVGNDIVSLNVDSVMKTAPIRSVVDLLDGRVPGMTVQRTSGSPGDPARIRLRGAGSILENNDPIIVVDGIRMYSEQSNERNANIRAASTDTSRYAKPSPLDQMDPNMIETIEVLKGPSAASLYGSDAANGVIVITTKHGKAGTAQWSIATDQGITQVPGKWPTVMWPWGKSAVSETPINCAPNTGISLCASIDSVVPFQALNEPRFTVAGRGYSSGVTATALGGRGSMQYAYTASMRDELGALKLPDFQADVYKHRFNEAVPGWMRRPEHLKTWSIGATNTMQVSDAASVSVTTALNHSKQHRTGLSDSFNSAISQLSRQWIDTTLTLDGFLSGNPAEQATSDQTDVTLGAQGQWQVLHWLPLIGAAGINILTSTDQIFLDAKRDPKFYILGQQPAGHLQQTDGRVLNQTATLNTNIPVASRLTVALGINYQAQQTADATGYFEGFSPDITNPQTGSAQDRLRFERRNDDRKTFGWFIEPQLSFQSRFFIMPGIRLDNNGLSGKNAGLNSLPKMNFSWIASEEPFFPFRNVIDLFRVRSAFGVAGVQPDAQDRYRLLEGLHANDNSDESAYYGDMLRLLSLGNTHLRPERSGEVEGGFDSELIGGRVKMDVTLYRKMRYDAIVGLPLASSIGGGEVKINLGVVRNQGSEVDLNVQLLESRSLAWNVGAAISTNRNKVVRLNGTDQTLSLAQGGGYSAFTQYYRVGYPLDGAWTKPILSYHDLDGNGILSPSEVLVGDSAVYMGSKQPTRTAALRSNFTFLGGRISFDASFNYTGGLTQTDGVSAGCIDGYISGCTTALALARYNNTASLDEQAAAVALAAYGSGYGIMRPVSTWRFQTASLNVNLGRGVAHIFRARTMNVALQGSNLHLWTNYRGKDPNVNAFTWGDNTADLGQLPLTRTWALRFSVGN